MIAFSSLAIEEGDLTPKDRDYIDSSLVSAQALLGCINQILEYSKISAVGAQAFELVREPFSLATIAEDLADIISMKVKGVVAPEALAYRCMCGAVATVCLGTRVVAEKSSCCAAVSCAGGSRQGYRHDRLRLGAEAARVRWRLVPAPTVRPVPLSMLPRRLCYFHRDVGPIICGTGCCGQSLWAVSVGSYSDVAIYSVFQVPDQPGVWRRLARTCLSKKNRCDPGDSARHQSV